MKIVVIGDGKVGSTIIEYTSQEGNEIIAIDKDPDNIEAIVNQYDIMGVCGNGVSYDVLKSAGVGTADLVVAATKSDEVNLLACMVAKKVGAKATIARVRNYEYNKQTAIFQKDLGLNMIINPESETASEITKILNFPQAIRVGSFNKGNFDLIEVYIPNDNPIVGHSLYEIKQNYQLEVLVCAVERNGEVYIPNGKFQIEAGDKLYVSASRRTVLRSFLHKIDLIDTKPKDVLIIGGGIITVYLGAELIKNKYRVKIIEKDNTRCKELSVLLPQATIICGDGTDQNLLLEEGLEKTDSIICLTGSDEENIVISMFASNENVKKIITKVNRMPLGKLMSSVSTASIISPKDITATRILSYVRAKNNTRGSNVSTLYKLVDNKVEALEFKAVKDKRIIDIPLKELNIKKNILIAGIVRDGEAFIPVGDDVITLDDNVIVVTTNQFLDDLSDILE